MSSAMEHSVTAQGGAQSVRTETRAAVWATLAGGALAALLTCGVLAGAVLASYNALGDVGLAAHIPDLPVAGLHALAVSLDGLAGVALLTLIVLQPAAQMRTYCWGLVGGCIGISMLANGAHAVFDDDRGHIGLPVVAAFAISTVPAASAAASLHLLLKIVARLVELVHEVLAALASAQSTAAEPPTIPAPAEHPAARRGAQERPTRLADAEHPAVLAALRSGRGYRTVMGKTKWGRPRAEAALRAARECAEGARGCAPDDTEPATDQEGVAA